MIVAGKSHPADDGGKALIQQVVRFADRPAVRHRIAFLPDYDMSMARLLYWGCDVWLNNPLRPLEACGTSGMKSALNGGLNLSIRDGWWDEWYDGENGWAIPTADGCLRRTPRRSGSRRAVPLARIDQVAPKYYDREGSIPRPRGRDGAAHAAGAGSEGVGLQDGRDYAEQYYAPAAESFHRTIAPVGGERSATRADWPSTGARSCGVAEIQISDVDSTGLPDTPLLGSKMTLTATVALAGAFRLTKSRSRPLWATSTPTTPGRAGLRSDGPHRQPGRRRRNLRHHDATAGGGVRRIHGPGVAASSVAVRRRRIGLVTLANRQVSVLSQIGVCPLPVGAVVSLSRHGAPSCHRGPGLPGCLRGIRATCAGRSGFRRVVDRNHCYA